MFRTGRYNYEDVLEVARGLRPEDKRELEATIANFTPEYLAEACGKNPEMAVLAYHDKEPVAVMGAFLLHPGVYSGYMFATPSFPVIGLAMTRWARKVYFPALRAMGAHRVEAHSIEGHREAHRWIEAIGAHWEAAVPCFGINKEGFVRFVKFYKEDE